MRFSELPSAAAWRHRDARQGFESTFLASDRSGYQLEGHTSAVEQGQVWAVSYKISLDPQWHTRGAVVRGRSTSGDREVRLEADGSGLWRVNGSEVAGLAGCLDVDLESSACTNTIPIHRLGADVGTRTEAPAAYVRALDLAVARLDQRYTHVEDDSSGRRYEYSSPTFDFECTLVYDAAGLVVEYPGIASRVV
jgi:uncharacterized protein